MVNAIVAQCKLHYNPFMTSHSCSDDSEPRGLRGGRTTVSADGTLVRKSFMIDRDTEKALRTTAHRTRQSEGAIVRDVLRRHFGLD
jgi:hypothetical protein